MFDGLRRRWMRCVVAVCLTVATIALGFAHRPLPGFADAAAMVEAGGWSFGTVCAVRVEADDARGGPTAKRVVGVCDACLLFAAPGLAPVAEIAPAPPVAVVLARIGIDTAAAGSRRPAKTTARGPPAAV
jgi:hypothetical protein